MSHKDGADHINVPDPLSEATPLPSNERLVRRLRQCRADGPLVNPDGDEAALTLLGLQREVERLSLEFRLSSQQAAGLRDDRGRLRAALETARTAILRVDDLLAAAGYAADSSARNLLMCGCPDKALSGEPSAHETSERSLPELLRRLDALTDLPVGVTAIADETIFRDAAAEIRSLERRLETANARIQRWQMPECTDPGWEMRDGQMACKGCNRSFSDIFNSAEARCRRRSPEKASGEPCGTCGDSTCNGHHAELR